MPDFFGLPCQHAPSPTREGLCGRLRAFFDLVSNMGAIWVLFARRGGVTGEAGAGEHEVQWIKVTCRAAPPQAAEPQIASSKQDQRYSSTETRRRVGFPVPIPAPVDIPQTILRSIRRRAEAQVWPGFRVRSLILRGRNERPNLSLPGGFSLKLGTAGNKSQAFLPSKSVP